MRGSAVAPPDPPARRVMHRPRRRAGRPYLDGAIMSTKLVAALDGVLHKSILLPVLWEHLADCGRLDFDGPCVVKAKQDHKTCLMDLRKRIAEGVRLSKGSKQAVIQDVYIKLRRLIALVDLRFNGRVPTGSREYLDLVDAIGESKLRLECVSVAAVGDRAGKRKPKFTDRQKDIYEAWDHNGQSPTEAARVLGCTKQYVSSTVAKMQREIRNAGAAGEHAIGGRGVSVNADQSLPDCDVSYDRGEADKGRLKNIRARRR